MARAVLDAEGVSATGADVEMSLLFVDEGAIASLNERFMARTGPTDVLSFPIDEQPTRSGRMPDNGPRGPGDERDGLDEDDADDVDIPVMLGDVVICPKVAAANAGEHQSAIHDGSVDDELALLVVHGVLHLLGMDHAEEDEAEVMEARERDLLDRYHRRAVPAAAVPLAAALTPLATGTALATGTPMTSEAPEGPSGGTA